MYALRLLLAFILSIFHGVASHAQSIAAKDADQYIGKIVSVCGTVVGAIYLERSKSKVTLLNLDKPYPNQIFTATIYGEDRPKFGDPEKACLNKYVCVIGTITTFRDKPQIVVKDRSQLKGC